MSPSTITQLAHRDAPVLSETTEVAEATRRVLESDLPALPVVDENGVYVGIFGEREFLTALFPGYVRALGYAAFVPSSIDDALERHRESASAPIRDYMNTEHIDVPPDASDVAVAETFLNHRVLIVPVTENRRVRGVITRAEFFRALAERFLEGLDGG